MKKTTGFYPRLMVDTSARAGVGQAGGVLVTSTVRAGGLDVALSCELARWRKPLATHDPAKVVLDLAIAPGYVDFAIPFLREYLREHASQYAVTPRPAASRPRRRERGSGPSLAAYCDAVGQRFRGDDHLLRFTSDDGCCMLLTKDRKEW